jgi:hypothetical protein
MPMGFYWAGFIFWLLIGAALLLFIYGLWKKSWKALLISGMILALPMLYFAGAENGLRFLALVPLIPFILSYYTKKRAKR